MPANETSRGNKPPIIPMRFRSVNQLYKSYMPWFRNGGLFIPTTKRFQIGQEILLMVVLPESREKLPATGIVSWVTPGNSTGHKKPGVGVEFSDDDGMALRFRLEGLLGEHLKSGAPTYTL